MKGEKQMKKSSKLLVIIMSLTLVLLFALETPTNALQTIIGEINLSNNDEDTEETSNTIVSEIKDERSEYTKTFRLENGNNLLVEYSVPIHYMDDNKWIDYDNTLIEDKILVTKQPERKAEITENSDSIEHTESETIFDNEQSLSTENTSENTNNNKNRANESNTVQTEHVKSNGETPIAATVSQENNEPTEEIKTYSNKNSNLDISFSKNTSEYSLVFVGENEKAVSWGYKDANKVNAEYIEDKTECEGNEKFTVLKNLISTVKYKSVYKDIDLELISSPVGVKENIIINTKDATNRFVCDYDIGKLTPKQIDDSSIALYNATDEVEYYINAEYMYDAKGSTNYDGLKLSIIDSADGKLSVELIADAKWLYDSERAYPVIIDPSFITGQDWDSLQCTYINERDDTAHGATNNLYSGTFGQGMNRSLIKMNNLPNLNNGDMIVDATLNLYLYNGFIFSTPFTSTEYFGVYDINETWSQNTVTWNNQPDYNRITMDYLKFDQNSEPDWYSMNITKAAKKWYEDSDQNYGVLLKAVDESECYQCASFFSSYHPEVIPHPAFQITYRNNKGIEDYWSTTSVNVGNAGTLYVNDYSGALTFITNIASTASPIKTASINYVYNSYMAGEKLEELIPYIGRGWRMNLYQTLYSSSQYGLTGESATMYPYVYTDADGTAHYFRKVTENNTTKYIDEDGLNLELTIKNGDWPSESNLEADDYYVITDKDKNQITFFGDGTLRTQKDSYNQKAQVRYIRETGDIKWVEDPSNNKIRILHKNDIDYVMDYEDANERTISIDYVEYDNSRHASLRRITRPDGTKSEFTYDSIGLLTSITDSSGYRIVIEYDNTTTHKVKKIEEYALGDTDDILGNTITFDRTQYNTTIKRSSGVDGSYNNSDDIITTYQFDNCGRTKSVQTKSANSDDLGASNYEYTSGSPNSSASNINEINRITAEHAVGANTFNFVKNHGFETSVGWTNSDWLDSNTFSGSYVTEQKTYGKKSYKIQSTAYNDHSAGRAYQDIDVTSNPNDGAQKLIAGETYTLSGYVKVTNLSNHESSNYGAVLCATAFKSNPSSTSDNYSEYISEETDTVVNDGWRRVSVTFTVPENAYIVRVNIALRAAIGTAYFDGVQLEKAETAGSYNLLENSSFEASESNTQPLSWNYPVGLTFSSSSDDDGCRNTQQLHGNKSFKINGDVTKNKYISQIVPVSGSANDTYIVSGWAKANSVALDADNVRKFKISISVHYTDGTELFKESADFNPTISDWQFVSKAFNLSYSTSSTKVPSSIEIYMNFSKEDNAAYFDNISLVKEPSQSYTYDSKGNLVSVVSNAEHNSTMEYNTDNKLTSVLDPKGYSYQYTYNNKGSVETATTQNGAVYSYTYDNTGSVTNAVGVGTDGTRVHSSQTISNVDANGIYTVTSYDQRDQASVSTYNAKTGTLKSFKDPKNIVTSYTYNSDNDLLTSVSKDNHTVSYSYDSNNRNLTGIDTATTDYSFTYDAFGARTQTDVGNRTLASYTYNNGGLLTRMDYGNDDYVTYEYDKFGNANKKYKNGTLAYEGITDNTGTVTRAVDHINNLQYDYTYDSTDRLISSTITNSNNNQRKAMFEYNFDANNNMSKFITLTPTGHNKVLYTYGKDNLLTGMTLNNQKTLDFVYDGIGRPTSHTINLIHPLTTAYTYHGITSGGTVYKNNLIRTEKIGNGDFWYLYHYDANNNINRLYQNAENEDNKVLLEDYSYDVLNQLENVNYYDRHERHEYTYDNGGNITEEKVYDTSGSTPVLSVTNTYTYGDNSWGDLLTGYNGDTITYDEIGNPLNYRDGITFTWSNGRQLQSYTKGNTNVSYTYDSSGMRLSKTIGGTTHTYLYNSGLLIQETIGNQKLDYSYTPSGQILSVKYTADVNSNETPVYYYYALNSRGDVVGLYDHEGNLYAKYTYDVWGNPVSVTNASGAEITSPTDFANVQPLRYRSYYYDTDTGFYYLQSRYYDPVTHRFINADGLVSTGTGVLGYNMFAYCENNSIINSDPSGERRNGAVKRYIARLNREKTLAAGRARRRSNQSSTKSIIYSPELYNPIGYYSYNKCSTLSVGFSCSLGAGLYGSVSKGMSIDTSGNVAFVKSYTSGISTPTISASGFFAFSNAKSVFDLKGESIGIGGSADADGVSVGMDVSWDNEGTFQEGVSVGVGPVPYDIHGGKSYTQITSSINLRNPNPSDYAAFAKDLLIYFSGGVFV